jgi:hypothetical protein
MELAEQRYIQIPPPVRNPGVGLRVTVCVWRRIREGRDVVPFRHRSGSGARIAHEVGSLVIIAAVVQDRDIGDHRVRQTRMEAQDAVERPSARQHAHKLVAAGTRLPEWR